MPRPPGARNHDFDEKRASLLDMLTDFALAAQLRRPSLRQFAIAAKQSEPTLRHYFGDRQGLVIDIIRNLAERARMVWGVIEKPAPDVETAVADYIGVTQSSLETQHYARSHGFGLIEGLADEAVGKVYLDELFEPSLRAFSQKLSVTPGGPTEPAALQAATLAVSGPLFMLAMHQVLLNGREYVPIETDTVFNLLKTAIAKSFVPLPAS